jgi:von Willebrand factor A domain-containing protein 5
LLHFSFSILQIEPKMNELIAGLKALVVRDKKEQQIPIPLRRVHVSVRVIQAAARVVIEQVYENNEKQPIEARYVFPLDDNTTVCDFKAELDGRLVRGTVKPKEKAVEEYEEAVQSGKAAFLMEQHSGDVFEMKVGNLLPGSTAVITITYVASLDPITCDTLRFSCPTSIFPRYSPPHGPSTPALTNPSGNATSEADYTISFDILIEMTETIQKVTSSTHKIKFSKKSPKSGEVKFSVARVALDKDFEFLIHLLKKTTPSIVWEYSEETQTVASQLCFVPNLTNREVLSEIVFVIDRSGSMASTIKQANTVLCSCLQLLPQKCLFNVVSFGDSFTFLHPKSVLATEKNIENACDKVKSFTANMGGTAILQPLVEIFKSTLREGYARQIFLLTDGGVVNTSEIIQIIRRNSHTTRVFTFGLGNLCSSNLVKGAAIAGGGKATFLLDNTDLNLRVTQQVQRALQASVVNIQLTPNPPIENNMLIRVVPHHLRPVFDKEMYVVYCLFRYPGPTAKTSFTLKGTLSDDSQVEWVCSEEKIANPETSIHCLALREIFRECEDGSSPHHERFEKNEINQTQLDTILEEEITKLSCQFNVLSKYTSFIAVIDQMGGNTPKPPPVRRDVPQYKRKVSSVGYTSGSAPLKAKRTKLLSPSSSLSSSHQQLLPYRIPTPFYGMEAISCEQKGAVEIAITHSLIGPRTFRCHCWMTAAVAGLLTFEPFVKTLLQMKEPNGHPVVIALRNAIQSWLVFSQSPTVVCRKGLSVAFSELASALENPLVGFDAGKEHSASTAMQYMISLVFPSFPFISVQNWEELNPRLLHSKEQSEWVVAFCHNAASIAFLNNTKVSPRIVGIYFHLVSTIANENLICNGGYYRHSVCLSWSDDGGSVFLYDDTMNAPGQGGRLNLCASESDKTCHFLENYTMCVSACVFKRK